MLSDCHEDLMLKSDINDHKDMKEHVTISHEKNLAVFVSPAFI